MYEEIEYSPLTTKIDISDKEISYISNYFNRVNFKLIKNYSRYRVVKGFDNPNAALHIRNTIIKLIISKLPDDYFIICSICLTNRVYKYYKCDQLYGLEQCLNKIRPC